LLYFWLGFRLSGTWIKCLELSLWDNYRLWMTCLIFGKIVDSQCFLGDFSNNLTIAPSMARENLLYAKEELWQIKSGSD
jgi:hypothetical protein